MSADLTHLVGDARRGPLTWGQLWPWLDYYRGVGRWEFATPRLRCPVPAGLSLADVRQVIRFVVARHESLRTSFHIGSDGEPYQQVNGVDTIEPAVIAMRATDVEYDVAERFMADASAGFDLTRVPVRIAILTDGARPRSLACVMHHVAADNWAATRLGAELASALAGQAARGGTEAGEPASRPLDEAIFEGSETGIRRSVQALANRAGHRRRLPHTLFPRSRPSTRACPASRARLTSRAVPLAAQLLARRHRTSMPAVYLAALAAVLSTASGSGTIGVDISSANRSDPLRRRLVSSLVLPALAVVDVEATAPFTDLLRRAASANLEALLHGDGDHTERMIADIRGCHERGVHFYATPEMNLVFSEIGRLDRAELNPAAIHRAAADSTAGVSRIEWFDRLRLEISVHRGWADIEVWTSEGIMTPGEALAVVRDIENVLLAAVDAADCPIADLAGRLLSRPPAPEAGWMLIDNCWTRPAELHRLLLTHPDVVTAAVFAGQAGGDPAGGELRAYLVTGREPAHPGRVHRWLVTAVAGCPAAMAAHRYTVCERAPADPADESAWRAMPVLAEGDGRGPVIPPTEAHTWQRRLLLDTVRRYGAPAAELDDCYAVAGGRLSRVPAILDALRTAGCQGVNLQDFLTTQSLAELAGRVHAIDDEPATGPASTGTTRVSTHPGKGVTNA